MNILFLINFYKSYLLKTISIKQDRNSYNYIIIYLTYNISYYYMAYVEQQSHKAVFTKLFLESFFAVSHTKIIVNSSIPKRRTSYFFMFMEN